MSTRFSQIYHDHTGPVLSVELFPPKTDRGWQNLSRRLPALQPYQLDFVSVTYGAGGSVRERTLDLVAQVRNQVGTVSVPHFAAIGSSRQQICDFLDQARAQGVENLVLLRGDQPQNQADFAANGFQYAHQLVSFVRQQTDHFDIAVAGYPEGHLECRHLPTSIQHLKQKVDAGANLVITQLFFNNADFFRFREMAVQAGITVPIVPGIIPIIKFSQIQRITALCGASIPSELTTSLSRYADGSLVQQQAGLDFTIAQVRQLLQAGVAGLHIYSLNNWQTVSGLVEGVQELLP